MEFLAQLSHETLDHSRLNTPHLVLTLKAPTLDWIKKRPPLCVVPAIDLSGSMRGDKLEYARKSLHKLVDQLQPGDVTGLVAFESRVHLLVQPAEVTAAHKSRMKDAINRLKIMGGTDLCGGALQALEVVKGLDLPAKFIKRVILFTDGQPTDGVTNPDQILSLIESNRGSVTLSAFGYGAVGGGAWGGCDPEFMENLSQRGQGNYAFIQDPDSALTAFGRELGGLMSTYAQDLLVTIEPLNGHRVNKVLTDVPVDRNALGEIEFKVSDIMSEETRHFVFETELVPGKSGPRAVNLFNVRLVYSALTDKGTRETKTLETKAKAQFVNPGEEQKDPSKALDEVIALAQVFRAQIEAEEQAKKGNYVGAVETMSVVSKRFQQRGLVAANKVAQNIGTRLGDAALYASNTSYLRSMSSGGRRSYGLNSADAEAQGDLEMILGSLGNDAINTMSAEFASNEPKPSLKVDISNKSD
jgi:Ca-activated chloride channel family protein